VLFFENNGAPTCVIINQVEVTLNKTITKNLTFVIFALISGSLLFSCSAVSSGVENTNIKRGNTSEDYSEPNVIGTIGSRDISESSGITISACQPNIIWTHNDSGDGANLFALDKTGNLIGKWRVAEARNEDWEDIAAFKSSAGDCYLYIGDIGNNVRRRDIFTIYILKEPKVALDAEFRKTMQTTEDARAVRFEYPDLRRDSETLMVDPQTGDVYILSKSLSDSSVVYKLAAGFSFEKLNRLEQVVDLSVPAIPNGFLTGGDISADGRRVVLCDYFNGYEIILPENAKNFDEIWRQKPKIVELGKRQQGEAITYSADGGSIFATSEKRNSPIIEVRRK
jgi:hypothetical protein